MKTHGLLRGILAVGTVVVLLAQAPAAQAATVTYTWNQTAANTYAWNSATNWTGTPAGFPNSGGSTNGHRANLSNNIAGDQTVQLNEQISLYRMDIGDSGTGTDNSYNVVANGGSFVFDNTATAFTLTGIGTVPAGNSIAANIQLNSNLTVDLPTDIDRKLTISGDITTLTSKTLTKTGVGTLVLTGSNSFTSTTMSAGTLAVNSNAALGAVPGAPTTNLSLSGGSTLRFDAAMTVDSNRGIALGASGATLNTQGNNVVYLGAFTGTTALTKAGTGRLTLASGMTQPLTITGGVVRVPASGWTSGKVSFLDLGLANATAVIESSGTFNKTMSGGTGIAMNGGSGGFAAYGAPFTINLESSGATRDSFIWDHGAGASAFFLRGGDALVLGSTTADNVVEWYDNIDLCGSSGGSENRLFKVIDNPSVTTDRGKITGNIVQTTFKTGMALEKIGNGLLELTGANTYSALTTVTGGTLLVNGTMSDIVASPYGAVTVASGGTLGGTGTINRPVTVSAGGTLAPGASAGTLHIVDNLILAGDALFEINGTSAGQYDRVVDVTALTYGGTLTIKTASMLGKFDLDLFDFTSKSGTFTAITDAGGHYTPGQLSMAYGTGILSAVPEPATMALLGLGGLCMGLARMRGKRRAA